MDSSTRTQQAQQTGPAQQTRTQTKRPAQQQATTRTHTVKKGESLSRIANKYGVTVAALKSANGLKGDNIQPGQKLKIPAKSSRRRRR